ncbi:PPE domain-containing protein [Nocardia grenadensis]|uniref:PPE domain-containing protein n=1 Tax=Nocardia grenadensis TaxID=931537 RepID=UPI0007A531B8|nr:PPE domain-containing protein [Nocardia grenadensis]
MALNVDLGELVSVAGRSADLARLTGAAVPREWVLPAGSDPISAQAVPQLNAQAAALFNATVGVLNKIQRDAHLIGQAAVEYAAADDEGARLINGSAGELVDNPVPAVEQVGYRRVPPGLSNMPVTTGDPLTFARQLQSGPGPEPAHRFADSVRLFNTSSRTQAAGDMDRAGSILQNWSPVGSQVAQRFTTYRGWMDQLGDAMEKLAQGAESYGNAFARAKAKHPTPEEILAARKKMLAAARSKNQAALAAATAEYNELNVRSGEATGSYATETGTSIANSSQSTGEAAAQTGAGGSGGSGDALSQMLPMLMSMMQLGSNGLSDTGDISDDDWYDDYYDDYGLGDYAVPSYGSPSGGSPSLPTMPGGGIPSAADVQTLSATTAMPLTAANAGGNVGGAPRVPVAETAAGGGTAYGRGAAGSPMMPYMPMSPGMGGAGGGGAGGERNRVVAWHPDRLMYVDDTPHTEPVIGERPTIAPTVTQPTPSPANQAPSRSGGNA